VWRRSDSGGTVSPPKEARMRSMPRSHVRLLVASCLAHAALDPSASVIALGRNSWTRSALSRPRPHEGRDLHLTPAQPTVRTQGTRNAATDAIRSEEGAAVERASSAAAGAMLVRRGRESWPVHIGRMSAAADAPTSANRPTAPCCQRARLSGPGTQWVTHVPIAARRCRRPASHRFGNRSVVGSQRRNGTARLRSDSMAC
jgi:hypothetical protein